MINYFSMFSLNHDIHKKGSCFDLDYVNLESVMQLIIGQCMAFGKYSQTKDYENVTI